MPENNRIRTALENMHHSTRDGSKGLIFKRFLVSTAPLQTFPRPGVSLSRIENRVRLAKATIACRSADLGKLVRPGKPIESKVKDVVAVQTALCKELGLPGHASPDVDPTDSQEQAAGFILDDVMGLMVNRLNTKNAQDHGAILGQLEKEDLYKPGSATHHSFYAQTSENQLCAIIDTPASRTTRSSPDDRGVFRVGHRELCYKIVDPAVEIISSAHARGQGWLSLVSGFEPDKNLQAV